eukprot:5803993-Amphidinium_carterae.1
MTDPEVTNHDRAKTKCPSLATDYEFASPNMIQVEATIPSNRRSQFTPKKRAKNNRNVNHNICKIQSPSIQVGPNTNQTT